MFLLFDVASNPGMRERSYNTLSERYWSYNYHNDGLSPQNQTITGSFMEGTVSVMWDCIGHEHLESHYSSRKMRPCVHEKIHYQAGPPSTSTGDKVYCPHWDEYQMILENPVVFSSYNGVTPYAYHDLVGSDEFADACTGVLDEWNRKLYSFQPSQIPDMSVFLAELRDIKSLYTVLRDVGLKLLGLSWERSEVVRKLDRSIRLLDRFDSVTHVREREEIRRSIKSLRDTLSSISSTRLGFQFGVQASIRDLIKLVASLYSYWDQLILYRPTSEKARRVFSKTVEKKVPTSTGCWGYSCYPGRPADVYESKVSVEGQLVWNGDFINSLRGSRAEKAVYIVLSQVGLFPDLSTVWELKRLSWLIDYFVRTEHLIIAAERACGLGFTEPFIYRECVSLRVEQTEEYWDVSGDGGACWRRNAHLRKQTVRRTHYERVPASPMSLVRLVKVLRGDWELGQIANAVAVGTQALLARFIKR